MDEATETPETASGTSADPVRERIRELLEKYPELGSRQLHDMAIRLDTQFALMPLRSFHARYVLPLKRARARAEGRISPRGTSKRARSRAEKAEASKAAAASRVKRVETAAAAAVGVAPAPVDEAAPPRRRSRASQAPAPAADMAARIRASLISFARRVAAAETKTEIIDAMNSVDEFVAEIITNRSA